jgi:hypothetical protein
MILWCLIYPVNTPKVIGTKYTITLRHPMILWSLIHPVNTPNVYGTQCHITFHFLLGKIRNGLIYIIFTLEQEMHSLGKDWVFSAYSARDDDVYHQ